MKSRYLTFSFLIWFFTCFICVNLIPGTILNLQECPLIREYESREDWNNKPAAIFLAIYVMQGGLHAFMLVETKAALSMMKFALNHPERFHNWWAAYWVGFGKCFYMLILELTNGIIICGRCNVIDTVVLYLALLGL